MNNQRIDETVTIVIADANVLYSRALRDYILYAAARNLISIRWSQKILDEFGRHLVKNVTGFTDEQAARLFAGMNSAHPYALVEPRSCHYAPFEELAVPDPNDRHVVAAAIAAEANVLCTTNIKDFPDAVMKPIGIRRITPDLLLSELAYESPDEMRMVHEKTVRMMKQATNESTLLALKRAGAAYTAETMSQLVDSNN